MLARTDIHTLVYDKNYVISWFEGKPADQMYSYAAPYRCAFAQFLLDHGRDPMGYYEEIGTVISWSHKE